MGGGDAGDEYDVVVIGSGMGGLACGAMCAKYGEKAIVLESHIKMGGSAHSFTKVHNKEKYSRGAGGFYESLREHASDGELAIKEFEALRSRLKTLGGSTTAVCLFNLRQDRASSRRPREPALRRDAPRRLRGPALTFDSLHKTVDQLVTEPFLRNFIDTMCIFCGFPAKGAMTAHMLYILERFFEPGCSYSFGMDISLNTRVAEILVEGGRACGVRLKSGKVIRARKAVVSNATPFDTEWRQTLGTLPRHGAILHLFVAVDAEKVVDGKKLADHPSWRAEDETAKNPAHLIVQDWSRSMQDSQNLCSFFIPSLLDRSVCPEGKHVIHVYSSGGEPYEPWEQLEPGSEAYEAYKEERANILWEALENCIPDARQRAEFHIVGSPLAHEAFLRRDRGTYGMAWAAGTSAPYAGLLKFTPIPFPFPNLKTPVDGLLRCGDSCFPGIGTPSAAASGVIAANTIVNVETHIAMLEETAKKDPMYKFLSPGPFQWLYRGLVSPLTPSKELRGSGVFQPSSGGRVSAAAEAASR
ncbi:all-trans-retinol 13,14-reductase [Aureococcus anophagefferens]|nr:all-trans-retinol 13,14-reductase [Aureococcus anophagefferens]